MKEKTLEKKDNGQKTKLNGQRNCSIVSPIYLVQHYKTKKDKNISLNMNWYRNVNFIVNNNMKKQYKDLMREQLEGLRYDGPIEIKYNLYWARKSDLDNWSAVISKYFQDALVEYGCIEDDNFEYIKKNTYEVIEKDYENPRFEITIKPYAKT